MGRTMTLRGTIYSVPVSTFTQQRVLAYESTDRTRAWIVKGAFVWPTQKDAPAFTKDGIPPSNAINCDATLWTDEANPTDSMDPAENRSIGWCNQGWLVNLDPIAGRARWFCNNGFNDTTELLIDVDRLVTNELYVGIDWGSAILDNPQPIDWGYMIVLEEVSVTASASLLQQLKGIGQSIQ